MWPYLVAYIALFSNHLANGNIITCDDLSNPTAEPSSSPSTTLAPTDPPTTTLSPTESPATTTSAGPAPTRQVTPCWGLKYGAVDIIILNDISCKEVTTTQCETQQEQIAYILKSIKYEDDTHHKTLPASRVGYIEFDGVNTNIKVSLQDSPYNKVPVTTTEIDEYFNTIKQSPVCQNISDRTGAPNLLDMFHPVLTSEFSDSQEHNRDMFLILFSNCKVPPSDRAAVCAAFDEFLPDVDAQMINNGVHFPINDDPYLMCLVNYDIDRVFRNTQVDNDAYYNQNGGILNEVQGSVCSNPTPAPTQDPTPEPTDYRRRSLLQTDQDIGSFDITGAFGTNAPCITMRVKLATENLVPLNHAPDVRSNIHLIGKALANISGAVVHIPDIPDTDGASDTDSEWNWVIDPSCLGDPQIDDVILPSTTETMNSSEVTVSINNSRLHVSMPLVTTPSVIYVYHVSNLPLQISHSCVADMVLTGAIYDDNGVECGRSSEITVTPNDDNRLKSLSLESTVRLQPGTPYEIVFESDTLAAECDLTKIDVGEPNTRRRMSDSNEYRTRSEIATDANPNSCLLGKALAKSDDMKTGSETFCQTSLGRNENAVKAGFFRMFGSQVALNNHGIRPGSIRAFNTIGVQTFKDRNFLRDVKKPCIAIDEDTKRVFALGGADTNGRAVDTISVYQFTNEELTAGGVMSELDGWVLDKPRYGSMCFYWKREESIVVISGMESTAYEFADSDQFFNDIRIFKIPQSASDLTLWESISIKRRKSFSTPDNEKLLHHTGVIGSRPLIYDNHILYLFGGRTASSSVDYVSRFDLDAIENTNEACGPTSMALVKDKAAPLIDEVVIDEGTEDAPDLKSCYMIFTGQSYEEGVAVEETSDGDQGLSVTNLQLYCNENTANDIVVNDGSVPVISSSNSRRLVQEEHIVRFSEFDREMMKEGRRRRLSGSADDADEILIREYTFDLDDIWYNFTVKFELCYANNEELETAAQNYQDSIDSKSEGNGDEWAAYKAETEENILNVSQEAYRGESNGFGAVRLFDLDILNITYLPNATAINKCRVPTESASRRRLHGAGSSHHNTPCMHLKVELETENLVPSNTNPDATSNIVLIAAALGELTSGSLTMPDIDNVGDGEGPPTEEEDDIWSIDPECIGEPQIEDNYFPQGIPFAPQLEGNASMDSDGFSVFIPFTTPASIVYVFEITALPLTIYHTCAQSLTVVGAIYRNEDDALMNETESVEVLPNESQLDGRKLLPFASSVILQPGTDYVIIYKSIDVPFPSDCDLSMIDIGEISDDDDTRRRMLDSTQYRTSSDFASSANPNSCVLGGALAKSEDMVAGSATFCQTESRSNEEAAKAGYFKMFGSQCALNNHGIRGGSIKVVNTNMLYTFTDTAWPAGGNIKKPCIAIDQATRRVFAVGGYNKVSKTNFVVVDTISVYQFDNDALTAGHVMTELSGWVLDQPRYGSMCFYWKQDAQTENIVVISGMRDTNSEFTNKKLFLNDIRIFRIPQSAADLTNWNNINGKKSSSKPDLSQYPEKLIGFKGIIGSRPLLYDNHILYLFGGRNHQFSKANVSSFNLNHIESSYSAAQSKMTLTKTKAAPLLDQVAINVGTEADPEIKDCYMILAGQSYQNGAAVDITTAGDEGVSVKDLQLFCNDAMADATFAVSDRDIVARRRRRLKEENIVSLSEFDRDMWQLKKGRKEKRRLSELEGDGAGGDEILIRDYNLNGLDDIWYLFDVEFEICYSDNEALRNGYEYYESVVNERGAEWDEWRLEMSDRILNESLTAYEGWSNGFGAVNVTNLEIVSVHYEKEMEQKLSHPQRRKHRFWAHNIEETNGENFIWIDKKLEDSDDDDSAADDA